MTVKQSAASSSLSQWAAEQHQELLAARDLEAMNKLAAGGTEDFIQYAMERIAALGDSEMKTKWQGLLKVAQERAGIKKTTNTVKQYAAMLQAGEMAGGAFLNYLQGELGKYDPGSDTYTWLTTQITDAKKWIDMGTRALEKRHDEEMAAWVQEQGSSKEALQTALDYYKGRRAQLAPGDEAYGALTKTIADIQNGIQASDFNAAVNTAHAKLIEDSATDPTAAKNAYLGTLVKLMNSARDPAAQQKLFEQVQAVRDSIKKDGILKDAQETNAKMVSYFAGDPNNNATSMLQFLAQKALAATDPAEGNRYTTLAQQIIAHERQKAGDAIAGARRASGGAGGGLSTASINAALNPFENTYKDALDTVNRKIDRGITPTQADWAILYEARSRYQDVIAQAYTQGGAAAKGALDNTERAVRDAAGSGTGWDFGKVGDKMAAKIVSDIKANTDSITSLSQKNDDPELLAQAIAKQLGDIQKAQASPFLKIAQDEAGKLTVVQRGLEQKVADTIREATDVISGNKAGLAIANLSAKYDAYAAGTGKLGFDEWMAAISKADGAQAFNALVGDSVTPTQYGALKDLIAKDKAETQGGITQLVAATQFRLPNGQIDPAWQAGGALDESTRAQNIQRILSGQGSAMDLVGAAPPPEVSPTGIPGAGPAAAYTHGSPGATPTFPAPLIPTMGGFGGRSPSLIDPNAGGAPSPTGTDVVQQPDAGGGAFLDAGQTGGAPPVNIQQPTAQPIDASIPQPSEPDPWAAGGYLDESTRAAQRASGFDAPDPHTAAWAFLNTPSDFALPTFTLPDLPPEPAFYQVGGGSMNYGSAYDQPSLTAGDVSPTIEPPATNYQVPDSPSYTPPGGSVGGSRLQ